MNISDALQYAADTVDRLDAEILLSHVLSVGRAALIAHSEKNLLSSQEKTFEEFVLRCHKGEPVAYILGEKSFWESEFKVTQATLIPRPETECLVETVLSMFSEDVAVRIVDLGTGCGAIACSIAKARPFWQVDATDVSKEALAVANENAQRLGLANVTFYNGSWCEALASDVYYDAIVSNPPYIAENDPHLDALQYEPQGALVSGREGLDAIGQIVSESPRHLKSSGLILLEHGYDQATAVQSILQSQGFVDVKTLKDLAGLDRVTMGVLR
ncbi:MAG: peptide chain release factor N(5)-glutamine methyltransferase [Gammaproteobacteria bacterium]